MISPELLIPVAKVWLTAGEAMQNVANPTALLQSAVLMLHHLDEGFDMLRAS